MSVSQESKPFDYCASPDGEDVLAKLGVIFKPVVLSSFAVSTIDVMLYSHPKGYIPTLARYAHFTWPIFGASTAFVLGSNLSGSLRKKDDKLNWFIGGMSSGAVIGLWRRTVVGGLVMGIAFGLLGVAKKDCIQNKNFLFYPDKLRVEYGGFRSGHQDYTLMQHRPGNWTTGEKN